MNVLTLWWLVGLIVTFFTRGRAILASGLPLLEKYKDFLFFCFVVSWAFPITLLGWCFDPDRKAK